MKIGKWTVRIEGWSLVFEPRWAKRVGELTYDGQHVWTNTGSTTGEDSAKHYSAEDIKRWQDDLRGPC